VMRPEDELVTDSQGRATGFRRKATTRQEVPHIRRVKVPVLIKKVVETTVQKKVPVTKLVEVADFEEVEEKYTVFREEKAQRPKKVWVEKVVDEEYTKKVPVTRTRVVKKPITRIEEVDDFQMVTVPSTKVVDVEGFRIDEVEDRKVVEVEEWEVYELLPQHTGEIIKGEERDLGPLESFQPYRKVGTQVITKDDAPNLGIDLENLETDHDAGKVSTMAPLATRSGDRLSTPGYTGGVSSPSPLPSVHSNQSTPAPNLGSASSSAVNRSTSSTGAVNYVGSVPNRGPARRREDEYDLDRY